MSTDYYLVSPSHRKGAQVGSAGFGGTQSYPGSPEVVDFIRWAIDEFVYDVIMVDEHRYHDLIAEPEKPASG